MNNNEKDNLFHKDKSFVSFEYDPSIFHADYSIYVLYRRIDNITAALFLVSDTLPDSEILKLSLRQTSMNCLGGIVAFIGSSKADVSDLQKVVAHVLELASKLNIAFWSGLISDMNASVLQKEIIKIHETLAEVISKYRSKHVIDPLLFSHVDLDIRHYKNSLPPQKDTMSYIKDIVSKRQSKGQIKDMSIPHHESSGLSVSQNRESESGAQASKEERRQVIVRLLSEKNNLSIKDFASVITSFSEKTIQRELLSMVEDGVIKKEGERRWSTYSLFSQEERN